MKPTKNTEGINLALTKMALEMGIAPDRVKQFLGQGMEMANSAVITHEKTHKTKAPFIAPELSNRAQKRAFNHSRKAKKRRK